MSQNVGIPISVNVAAENKTQQMNFATFKKSLTSIRSYEDFFEFLYEQKIPLSFELSKRKKQMEEVTKGTIYTFIAYCVCLLVGTIASIIGSTHLGAFFVVLSILAAAASLFFGYQLAFTKQTENGRWITIASTFVSFCIFVGTTGFGLNFDNMKPVFDAKAAEIVSKVDVIREKSDANYTAFIAGKQFCKDAKEGETEMTNGADSVKQIGPVHRSSRMGEKLSFTKVLPTKQPQFADLSTLTKAQQALVDLKTWADKEQTRYIENNDKLVLICQGYTTKTDSIYKLAKQKGLNPDQEEAFIALRGAFNSVTKIEAIKISSVAIGVSDVEKGFGGFLLGFCIEGIGFFISLRIKRRKDEQSMLEDADNSDSQLEKDKKSLLEDIALGMIESIGLQRGNFSDDEISLGNNASTLFDISKNDKLRTEMKEKGYTIETALKLAGLGLNLVTVTALPWFATEVVKNSDILTKVVEFFKTFPTETRTVLANKTSIQQLISLLEKDVDILAWVTTTWTHEEVLANVEDFKLHSALSFPDFLFRKENDILAQDEALIAKATPLFVFAKEKKLHVLTNEMILGHPILRDSKVMEAFRRAVLNNTMNPIFLAGLSRIKDDEIADLEESLGVLGKDDGSMEGVILLAFMDISKASNGYAKGIEPFILAYRNAKAAFKTAETDAEIGEEFKLVFDPSNSEFKSYIAGFKVEKKGNI